MSKTSTKARGTPSEQQSQLNRADNILRFVSVTSVCISLAIFASSLWRNRWIPALSTDSLVYHLTIPAKWTQIGALAKFDIPFHDGTAIHSPLLTEFIIYLLMFWTGNDAFAWLVQPAFFLVLVYVFYSTLKLLEVTPVAARLVTSLLILFAPFFRSAQIVNSEMVMTTGTAVFCYGLLLARKRSRLGHLLAAMGIALLLSTKTIGIIYGALGLLAWALVLFLQLRQQPSQTNEGTEGHSSPTNAHAFHFPTVIGCSAIITVGAFFPIRNFIEQGNPLYPATLSLAGISVFEGLYSMSVFVDHGWSPTAISKLLFHDAETFAMKFHTSSVLWGAWLAIPIFRIRGWLKGTDSKPIILFWFYPLVAILLYFLFIPFWREHRLLCPLYYLLWCGLGSSTAIISRNIEDGTLRKLEFTFAAAFILYLLPFLIFDPVPLVVVGAASVSGVIIANFPSYFAVIGKSLPAIPIGLTLLAWFASPLWYPGYVNERSLAKRHFYPLAYEDTGKAWDGIQMLTEKRPGSIAYSGTALIFPLFGDQLQNQVQYIPIHPEDKPSSLALTADELIYLQLAVHRRQRMDEQFWLEGLRAAKVDYLFLVDDPRLGGIASELNAAYARPEMFEPIFELEGVYIFQLKLQD